MRSKICLSVAAALMVTWGSSLMVQKAAAVGASTSGSLIDFNGDFQAEGLGQDGYWFADFQSTTGSENKAPPSTDERDGLPSYVTMTFGAGVDAAGGWGSYDDFTLPSGEFGDSGAIEINNDSNQVLQTGVQGNAGGAFADEQFEYMTLTFGAGTPSSMMLGLVADNSDNAVFSNEALVVNGVSTGSLINNATGGPDETDVYFFLLEDISPGDTVQIDGVLNADFQTSQLGGIVLDVVPEPGSMTLLLACLGGFAFPGLRRRRRR